MRFIVAWLLMFTLIGCTSKPAKEVEANSNPEVTQTCESAIKKIAESLDVDSIKTLKETKKEDLVMFHLSWGMGIRNSYGLWSESSPIRKSCAQSIGEQDMHPDNASGIIMEGVWEIVNGANM